MTHRTLPALSDSDADDVAIEIIAALLSQPNKVGPTATQRVVDLLDRSPTVEWEPWILVANGVTPWASWVSDQEATGLLLEAHEVLVPVAAIAESIVAARVEPADEPWLDEIDYDRLGAVLDKAVTALMVLVALLIFGGSAVVFARQAGAESTGSTISSSTSWPSSTVPAPVLTTLATTPLPDLTPATIPTPATSDPAPTTTTTVLVGGELPRTGPNPIGVMGAIVAIAIGSVLVILGRR